MEENKEAKPPGGGAGLKPRLPIEARGAGAARGLRLSDGFAHGSEIHLRHPHVDERRNGGRPRADLILRGRHGARLVLHVDGLFPIAEALGDGVLHDYGPLRILHNVERCEDLGRRTGGTDAHACGGHRGPCRRLGLSDPIAHVGRLLNTSAHGVIGLRLKALRLKLDQVLLKAEKRLLKLRRAVGHEGRRGVGHALVTPFHPLDEIGPERRHVLDGLPNGLGGARLGRRRLRGRIKRGHGNHLRTDSV